MGKSERNQATDMTKQNYATANATGTATQNQLQGMLGDAQTRTTDAYNTASDGYKGMMGGTGAYDPGEYQKIQGQNDKNIQTGGYNADQLQTLRGQQQSNIQTAGYNPGDVSKVNANYDALTAGGLGGINSDSAANIRGGYNKLSTTGGIDEATADAMRRQTASGVASTYSTLGSNLSRKNAASGFGGGGGETAQLARQLGNTQAEAVTGVNAEIGKLRQTGTIAGLGGLSEFEQGAASGQRAAVAGQSQFAGDQAKNRLAATDSSARTEGDVAAGTLKASQAQQDLATGAANQRIQAAGGMANLYQSNPGYVTSMVQSILQSQSINGTLTTEQTQIMQELSKQPGLFGNIMNGIKTLGGTAAGVMTGIGFLNQGGGGANPGATGSGGTAF